MPSIFTNAYTYSENSHCEVHPPGVQHAIGLQPNDPLSHLLGRLNQPCDGKQSELKLESEPPRDAVPHPMALDAITIYWTAVWNGLIIQQTLAPSEYCGLGSI